MAAEEMDISNPPVDYSDEKEMKLRCKQLDYILYYAKDDHEKASEIHEKLKTIPLDEQKTKLDGVLYDDPCPFQSWKYSNEHDKQGDLFQRSTFKFFVISDNLADDIDLIKSKNEGVAYDLKKQDQSIVPLWLVHKRELNDDAFDALHGFTSLQGLDYKGPNDDNFTELVTKMANMPMFTQRKIERQQTQEKKLHSYLEDKTKKLGARRTAQRTPINRGNIECFTVAKSFWRRFKRFRNGGEANGHDSQDSSMYFNSQGSVMQDGGSSSTDESMESQQPQDNERDGHRERQENHMDTSDSCRQTCSTGKAYQPEDNGEDQKVVLCIGNKN